MHDKPTVSQQLRNLIAQSGYSRYRISQETGIDQAVLSRFVNNKRGMSLSSIDALGEFLQITLTSTRGGQCSDQRPQRQ